ncbi:MAG: S-layer homology domain-containing protein [Eubacteriales bacterium]
MKKNIKITAYILIILMISTLLTAGIYASFNDVTEYQKAIETLNSIGVITGRTAAQFSPDENVTRWQMALLMTKLLTGDIDNSKWASSDDTIIFSDVVNNIRHYGGSIAYAVRQSIIIGRSDTVFAPDDGITLQEAATIMVRALGYPRSQYDAGYPDSYIEKANTLGLFEDLENVYPTDILTRGETAQLLFNAFTAPKRIGATIAEDVFDYSDATIVLTATEDLRISSRVTLAPEGKLVFCELKPDGTVDTTTKVSLPASDFDLEDANDHLGKSFRVTAVQNYGNILSISECESETLTQNTISSLLSVYSAAGDYIKLDNVTYEVVSKYSYDLEENITPQSKQMIIYGVGEDYETSAVLSAPDIYGTNAYYTLTTYDDNSDGYPDRALYRPYSFALYTKTGTDIKLEGALTHNLKTNAVTLTGASVTTGSYVIYSYIPDTSVIDILKVMPVVNGTVVEYDSDSIRIKPVTSTTAAGTEYAFGNNLLQGAYTAAVKNIFTVNPTVSYKGSNIKYVADGPAVLMIDITGPQDNNTQIGYISQRDCAVIQAIDTSNVLNGYLTLGVFRMDGTTADPIHVKVIDNNPVNAITMNSIAISDIIEYTVFQQGATNSNTYYSITNISSKPYVAGTSNAAYTYYIGADTINIGIGYKTAAAQTNITYQGSLHMSSGITVIYYNGYYFENISNYINGNVNYYQQIASNCSMYASYGISGTAAKFVYVRPKYIPPAGTVDTSEFSRILYLSQLSINNKYPDIGTIYYPNAFDFIGGRYVTGAFAFTQGVNKMPQTSGFYKAGINSYSELMLNIKEPDPIAGDITNANIVYDKETSMTGFNKTSNTYTITLGGVIYTTNNFSMYKYNTAGIIEEVSVSTIANNALYPVDVYMIPANTAMNSARIALLWRQA